MFGTVNANLEAVVRLRVSGPAASVELDVTIDTGFNGFKTLPPGVMAGLGLVPLGIVETALADGTVLEIDSYSATLDWDGLAMTVPVSAVGDEPLIGMSLLYAHALHLEVLPGGRVEFRPLP